MICADSDPVRQALFANLKTTSLLVGFVCWFHKRLGKTWASTILVSCYGLKSFLSIATTRREAGRMLAVASHANARRKGERVVSLVGT